ncbi:MAG: hypothetical protein AVDCRST_MAG28-1081 [uncultured Rubrobacteraceae bacterium]|uniref:O-methyltransferase n=1 Tax=uncultured Rubrobacteraceae bacterium TaxID=349277 RepID=A0A6J4QLB1_9ACTN|nr:MAG: hypothetical protein AVDCRST_MAG28-1081 [uncultured Rubrobacteraceae bacterium]
METMDAGLLDELEEWGRANDAQRPERSGKVLNLESETAGLIGLLIRSGRRSRLLEIGTSNGYSTIWLAWAASAASLGGRVTSIERNPEKQAMADENLRRAGLRDVVDLVLGDATEVVASLPGPFDFVFFDADRVSAAEQLSLLVPKLNPDVMLLADNVLSHPAEISGYLAAVQSLLNVDHLVIPIGKGLSVAYRDAS